MGVQSVAIPQPAHADVDRAHRAQQRRSTYFAMHQQGTRSVDSIMVGGRNMALVRLQRGNVSSGVEWMHFNCVAALVLGLCTC